MRELEIPAASCLVKKKLTKQTFFPLQLAVTEVGQAGAGALLSLFPPPGAVPACARLALQGEPDCRGCTA